MIGGTAGPGADDAGPTLMMWLERMERRSEISQRG